MAPSIKAMLASALLLVAAPLVSAAPTDARSCALCWETATNQAQSPACTGISDDSALASCLCADGNKAIFDTCESACASSSKAPSTVCSSVSQPDLRTCSLCWETATNQAHTPVCTGLNLTDTDACLCKPGNHDIFKTCNAQCTGFPLMMPKNVCAPKVSARANGNTASKRDANAQLGWTGPCGPVPGTSCGKIVVNDAESTTPIKREADAQLGWTGPCGAVPGTSCGKVIANAGESTTSK